MPNGATTRKVGGGTMRYIGSKTASLPAITKAIRRGGVSLKSLCDPFAGTCTVSRQFKAMGWRVVTGDLLAQSYALQVAYVELNHPPAFPDLTLSPESDKESNVAPHGSTASESRLQSGIRPGRSARKRSAICWPALSRPVTASPTPRVPIMRT
jgi:hypothetical protein